MSNRAELAPAIADDRHPLAEYARHLDHLHNCEQPSVDEVLAVMLARDALQQWLNPQAGAETISKAVYLDERLKQQSEKLVQLAVCRETVQPPAENWWWWLSSGEMVELVTPEQRSQKSDEKSDKVKSRWQWTRWDWLWNLGTVSCLVISTGLISQTAKSFSKEGFDLLGTVSTIGQGAGVAIVARGALTDQGKQKIKRLLESANIPQKLHAEATFAGSMLLLTTSFGLYANLPNVGNLYYHWGQRQEDKEDWGEALENYERAARFNPGNSDIPLASGRLQEKLGNYEEAIAIYETGARLGNPEFSMALASATMMHSFQSDNWQTPIDETVLNQAELLLKRVDVMQMDDKDADVDLLFFENSLNNAVLQLLSLDWNDLANISAQDKTALTRAVAALSFDESLTPIIMQGHPLQMPLPKVIGKLDRFGCYHYKLTSLLQTDTLSNQFIDFNIFAGRSFLLGNPMTYQSHMDYLCANILRFSATAEHLNDAVFLEQLEQSVLANTESEELNDALFDVIQNVARRTEDDFTSESVRMVADSTMWQTMRQQLTEQIQSATAQYPLTENSSSEPIIWRIFMTDKGQIADHFTYGESSGATTDLLLALSKQWDSNSQDWIASYETDEVADAVLKDNQFADLKVVFHPADRRLEISDWQSAYPASFTDFPQPLKNLPAVDYSADILDASAEQSILADVVRDRLSSMAQGDYGADGIPSEYEVTVAANGQIVSQRSRPLAKDFSEGDLPIDTAPSDLPQTTFTVLLKDSGYLFLVFPRDS